MRLICFIGPIVAVFLLFCPPPLLLSNGTMSSNKQKTLHSSANDVICGSGVPSLLPYSIMPLCETKKEKILAVIQRNISKVPPTPQILPTERRTACHPLPIYPTYHCLEAEGVHLLIGLHFKNIAWFCGTNQHTTKTSQS